MTFQNFENSSPPISIDVLSKYTSKDPSKNKDTPFSLKTDTNDDLFKESKPRLCQMKTNFTPASGNICFKDTTDQYSSEFKEEREDPDSSNTGVRLVGTAGNSEQYIKNETRFGGYLEEDLKNYRPAKTEKGIEKNASFQENTYKLGNKIHDYLTDKLELNTGKIKLEYSENEENGGCDDPRCSYSTCSYGNCIDESSRTNIILGDETVINSDSDFDFDEEINLKHTRDLIYKKKMAQRDKTQHRPRSVSSPQKIIPSLFGFVSNSSSSPKSYDQFKKPINMDPRYVGFGNAPNNTIEPQKSKRSSSQWSVITDFMQSAGYGNSWKAEQQEEFKEWNEIMDKIKASSESPKNKGQSGFVCTKSRENSTKAKFSDSNNCDVQDQDSNIILAHFYSDHRGQIEPIGAENLVAPHCIISETKHKDRCKTSKYENPYLRKHFLNTREKKSSEECHEIKNNDLFGNSEKNKDSETEGIDTKSATNSGSSKCNIDICLDLDRLSEIDNSDKRQSLKTKNSIGDLACKPKPNTSLSCLVENLINNTGTFEAKVPMGNKN
ncbi:hypothetical protein BB560_004433 [Smittium megazygosporum]|uniref:Uncharacterized protein n=1 Tax=Smittium megazygosporum TaxID=133381 RepID=A0A2T9Z982_9FUNG|nr:hypothetical protein BB560_004433 [Smittium megazygosporum]